MANPQCTFTLEIPMPGGHTIVQRCVKDDGHVGEHDLQPAP